MDRTFAIIRGVVILLLMLGGIGWFIWRSVKKSDDPARALFRWVVTGVVVVVGVIMIGRLASGDETVGQLIGLILALILGLMLAILWVPHMAAKVGDWFGNLYTGGGTPADPTPFYSIAQAMRKKARPDDAIREIRKQLQKFPRMSRDTCCWRRFKQKISTTCPLLNERWKTSVLSRDILPRISRRRSTGSPTGR